MLGAGLVKGEGDREADAPSFENPNFVGQSRDEGRMPFRMKNREGMIAKGKNGGGRWGVGNLTSQDYPLMSEVQSVKKSQSEMLDRFFLGRGCQRVGQIHERRMREISGREIR